MENQIWVNGQGESGDPLLQPFLALQSEDEALEALDELKKILKDELRVVINRHTIAGLSNLSSREIAEDVLNDLLFHLWELRKKPNRRPIKDLKRYAKTFAKNSLTDLLRVKDPRFRPFSDSLKYRLRKDPSLVFWKARTYNLLVNFRGQGERLPRSGQNESLKRMATDKETMAALIGGDIFQCSEEQLAKAVLKLANHPIEFSLLAGIVFKLRHEDIKFLTETGGEDSVSIFDTLELSSEAVSSQEEVAEKEFLQALWSDVLTMPVEERRAFLLSKRNIIDVFEQYQTPPLRVICEALQLTDEHFERVWPNLKTNAKLSELPKIILKFVELWKHLPLELESVAGMFDLTVREVREHVAQARERLTAFGRNF